MANVRSIRSKTLNLICKIFKKDNLLGKLPRERINKLALKIENSCLEEAVKEARHKNIMITLLNKQCLEVYQSIIYNVISNIDPESQVYNNTLISRIYSFVIRGELRELLKNKFGGEIIDKIINYMDAVDVNNIGALSSMELNPQSNAEEFKFVKLRSEQHVEQAYTEYYTCHRCGNKKCTVTRYQIRSSDEGYTYFIKCLCCPNSWKING